MKAVPLVVLAAAFGLAAMSCDDAGSTLLGGVGTSCDLLGVTVSPASITMVIGDSTVLRATLPTCGGLPVGSTVFWRSSNTGVASVDSLAGTVRAIAAGQATVIAVVGSDTLVKGAAAVTVNAK